MTKLELLSFEGRLSELNESDRKEAIDFYKSLIKCYDEEHKDLIFDLASDGVDYSYEDFVLANASRYVYQKNKSKYEGTVKQYIKTR